MLDTPLLKVLCLCNHAKQASLETLNGQLHGVVYAGHWRAADVAQERDHVAATVSDHS